MDGSWRITPVLSWRVFVLSMLLTASSGVAGAAKFYVTTITPSGPGSLDQAIQDANASAGLDSIYFDTLAVPTTIISTGLTSIQDPVLIDGYSHFASTVSTAPAGSGANMTVTVEIDASGLGPGSVGLSVDADDCHIRGLAIYGHERAGILIQPGRHGNRVTGMILGTTDAGGLRSGGGAGVEIEDAHSNEIGGILPEERNWIVGADNSAALGVLIRGAGSVGNSVVNSQFGTDKAGFVPHGGLLTTAIRIANADGNVIGGPGPEYRNILSAANLRGLSIYRGHGNRVQGNIIGSGVTGTEMGLGNGLAGVRIEGRDNLIGGPGPGEGNKIVFNSGRGVAVAQGKENSILGNHISANGGIGIDLGVDGVTANDWLDWDSGPNDLQNMPLLTDATISWTGTLTVSGIFAGEEIADFRLEFFANDVCDPSTFGEGAEFLGFMEISAGIWGLEPFTFTLPGSSVSPGQYITSTATQIDSLGGVSTFSTSEFSPCEEAVEIPFPFELVLSTNPIGNSLGIDIGVMNPESYEVQNVTVELGPSTQAWGACVTSSDLDTGFDYGSIMPGFTEFGPGPHVVHLDHCPEQAFTLPLTVSYYDPQANQSFQISAEVLINPLVVELPDISVIALPEGGGVAGRALAMDQSGGAPSYVGGEILDSGSVWRPALWSYSGAQWNEQLLPGLGTGLPGGVLAVGGPPIHDIRGGAEHDKIVGGHVEDADGNQHPAIWVADGASPYVLEVVSLPYDFLHAEVREIIQVSDAIYLVGGGTLSSGESAGFVSRMDALTGATTHGVWCLTDGEVIVYVEGFMAVEMDIGVNGASVPAIVMPGRQTAPPGGLPTLNTHEIGTSLDQLEFLELPLPPGHTAGSAHAIDEASRLIAGVTVDANGEPQVTVWEWLLDSGGGFILGNVPAGACGLLSNLFQTSSCSVTDLQISGFGRSDGTLFFAGHATTSFGTIPLRYQQNADGDWFPSIPLFEADGLRGYAITDVDPEGRMSALGLFSDGVATKADLFSKAASDSIHGMFIGTAWPTAIGDEPKTPRFNELQLEVYPTPFNPSVRIAFSPGDVDRVEVQILDLKGRMVAKVYDGPAADGEQVVQWSGQDARGRRVSSGLYFARVVAGERTATAKLVLVK